MYFNVRVVLYVVSERDNLVCSSQCTSDGCWGRSDDQCLSCRNFHHGQLCVSSCEQSRGLYTKNNATSECGECHEQCEDLLSACTGPVRVTISDLFQ